MRKLNQNQVVEFFAQWLTLLTVLGLALALRLNFVTGMVFYDDLAYAQAAHDVTQGVLQLGPWGGLPRLGLYAPVALLYALFGSGDPSTLAWPLFCSLLTVIVVYAIGRLLAGEAAGLLSALLWALFPLDIQMATALLPDGPLVTFTAGTVLFFLLGERSRSRRSMLAYIASLASLAVAMLIKPLAILLLVFFAAYLVWKRPSFQTWVIVGAAVLVTGTLFLYYRLAFSIDPSTNIPGENVMQLQTSALVALSSTATDWFQVLTQRPEFFAFVPLFMVALTVGLVTRQRQAIIPLIWAGSVFLYFELGSTTPFRYAPIPANLMSRQILLVMVPFVVLTGIYLAQGLSARVARIEVVGLAIVLAGIAWWNMRGGPTSSPFLILSSMAAAIAIFVGIVSPVFVLGTTGLTKSGLTALLLGGVALATLDPTYSMVSPYYHLKLVRARQIASWIQAQPSDYPVFVDVSGEDAGLAERINYASGFRLGYDAFAPEAVRPGYRIQALPPGLELADSAFVIVQSGSKIKSVPETWAKTAQFDVLQVYQALSPDDASNELTVAQSIAQSQPNRDSLQRLLRAAINADAPCAVAWAWQKLQALDSEASSGFDPIQALSKCYITHPEIIGPNLLQNGSFERILEDWYRDSAWRLPSVGKDENGVTPILNVAADGTENWQVIVQTVKLQPDTSYVFEMIVRSTAPLIALYWQADDFAGMLEDGKTYPEWTHLHVVFNTPHWDGQPRPVLMYPFLLKGVGTVSLKQVRLAQLQVVGP